jgi:mannosyltransferase
VATGAILASSTFLLYYAGEARGYALATALAVVATLLFMRAVETGERRAWLFWAFAAAALVYTQVLAALLIGAQLASLVFLGRERPRSLVYGLAWLGALVAPLAVIVASSADKGQTDWASKLKVVQLQDFGAALAGARPLRVVFALIVATAVALLVRELARNGRSPAAWRLAVPVCWTVLPVLALGLISVAKGMFVDRYLLFIVPGFAVLAGAVVAELPRVAGRVLLATLLIGCTALAIAHPPWERKRSEDLRAAAAFVAAGAQRGDGIAYSPAFARLGFGFYLDKQRRQPRDLDVGESATARGDLFAGEAPAPVVAQRLMAAKRVWIVGYPRFPWHPTPEPVMAVAPQILRERFKPAGRAQFGEIVVALYRRAG